MTNLVNPFWFAAGGTPDPTIVWDTTPLSSYWNADGSNDAGADTVLYFYENVQLPPAAAVGYSNRIDSNNWYTVTVDPGGFTFGEYLLKYEQVTLVSGAWVNLELNYVASQEGIWVDMHRAALILKDYVDDATVQHVIVDVTIATDDGAGSPVAGSEKTKRVTMYADYGNSRDVYDLFAGVNGTAITAHTPNTDTQGGGWVIDAGTPELLSGHLVGGAAGDHRCVIDVGYADAICRGQFRADSGGAASSPLGLIVRRQDASNYWELTIVDAETANPKLELNEINAGSPTNRDTVTMTGIGPLDSLDCWLQIETSGNTLDGYFDGPFRTIPGNSSTVTYSSASMNTQQFFGIRTTGTTALIDNFAAKVP